MIRWQAYPSLARYVRAGKVFAHVGGRPSSSFARSNTVQITTNDFVTVAEASKRLGVAPNTLRSWGALGKIQEYRHPMNNYRLYRLDDLQSLVELLSSPVKVGDIKCAPKQQRREA